MLESTHARRVRRARRILALLCSAALATGVACNATPPPKPNRTEALGGSGVEKLQPAEIVLAPIQNMTEDESVPLAGLREAFYRGLVDRMYSPLDLAYVDGHWAESSFRGATPPDATLLVSLKRWNARGLYSSGKITAEAELRLFEGGSPSGDLLWGVSVARELDFTGSDGRVPAPSADLIPRAIRLFVQGALEQLPMRDALRAPRR